MLIVRFKKLFNGTTKKVIKEVNRMRVVNHKFTYSTFILSILLILSSCITYRASIPGTGSTIQTPSKSGNIAPLSQSNLSKIKNIAVVTRAEEDFSVKVSRAKDYYTDTYYSYTNFYYTGSIDYMSTTDYGLCLGCAMIDLAANIVAGGIEHGIRSHNDQQLEELLMPQLEGFNQKEITSESFKKYLEDTNHVDNVLVYSNYNQDLQKSKGANAILEIIIKDWGLILGLPLANDPFVVNYIDYLTKLSKDSANKYINSPDLYKPDTELSNDYEAYWNRYQQYTKNHKNDDYVSAIFNIKAKIVSLDDGKTIWEHNGIYFEYESGYWIEELRTQDGLLTQVLTNAIDDLAKRTVNGIVSSSNTVD